MPEYDGRPFWRRHPLIAISIAFVSLLGAGSGLIWLWFLGMDYPYHPSHHKVQAAVSAGLAGTSLLTLCVLIGAWWKRRTRPRPDSICANCGYDRTGVPDLSPCPECGAPETTD